MGRPPCCDKSNVKKGPWSPEEDAKLKEYIEKYGTGGNWIALPQKVGLIRRCGKSCRMRWLNYLRTNIKHGDFCEDEDRITAASMLALEAGMWLVLLILVLLACHLQCRATLGYAYVTCLVVFFHSFNDVKCSTSFN